jgi:type VI secretion system protein VasD
MGMNAGLKPWSLVAIVLLCLTTTGCSSSLKVTLISSNHVNPDKSGKPLSVVVRVYQLSNKDRFEKADFLSLVKADKRLLDKDLLSRREVTLLPDSKEVIKEERKDGAEYIAVMALFRDGDQTWRKVVSLKDLWIKSVKVRLDQRAITVD